MSITACVVTHGGAGSEAVHAPVCAAAGEQALRALAGGASALDSAVEAAVALEESVVFNAGRGSNLRLDGRTIENDAAVMSSDGRFGGVLCLRGFRNPVRAARLVAETPHLLLSGDGARAFARLHGLEPESRSEELLSELRARWARAALDLQQGHAGANDDVWRTFAPELPRHWNFALEHDAWAREVATQRPPPGPAAGEGAPCDTIGVVLRDEAGRFAVATSTGGTAYMLLGRVGDAALLGCGLYAGPAGAVAATGRGEDIIRAMVSRTAYEHLAAGASAQQACERALTTTRAGVSVGLIAVGRDSAGTACTRTMACATVGGYSPRP